MRRRPITGGDIDEKQKRNQKTGLEEAEGEKGVEFTERGLMGDRNRREERVEIAAAEEGEAEEFIERPESDEGDEEESDGPQRIEALEMVGGSGFESEMEDEGEREKGEEEEYGDEGDGGDIGGGRIKK